MGEVWAGQAPPPAARCACEACDPDLLSPNRGRRAATYAIAFRTGGAGDRNAELATHRYRSTTSAFPTKVSLYFVMELLNGMDAERLSLSTAHNRQGEWFR